MVLKVRATNSLFIFNRKGMKINEFLNKKVRIGGGFIRESFIEGGS